MTIKHNGKTLKLSQTAYIDGVNGQSFYRAAATDDQGNLYKIKWDITHPDPKRCEDESEMCNWDNFTVEEV